MKTLKTWTTLKKKKSLEAQMHKTNFLSMFIQELPFQEKKNNLPYSLIFTKTKTTAKRHAHFT